VGQIEFGGHDSTTALVDAKSGEVLDISPRPTDRHSDQRR
jgi:hypothetical protein